MICPECGCETDLRPCVKGSCAIAAAKDALQRLVSLYDKCTDIENFSEQWIDAIEEAKAALLSGEAE
jgi:hypothetical protein